MSDKHSESSGATATVVLILLLLGLVGMTILGGGAAVVYFRTQVASRQAELLAARAEAEMVAAQMQAQAAAAAAAATATQKSAPSPEILVEITAAGDYRLAGKAMEYYDDLKAELLAVYIERGPDLQVVISADKETRFDRVTKAVEAAECAGITKHRILAPTSQPPAVRAATEAAPQP